MRKIIKYLVTTFYKPLLERYTSSIRYYHYKNIHLLVPPEVFHPGFFFSTKILFRYLNSLPMQQKSLLELGAGSGLIAISAAKNGAMVTASDINPVAIECIVKNKKLNDVELRELHSDLFNDIPRQTFDYIAINPPFYKNNPATIKEYAWYCGKNGEYFSRLFQRLGEYMNDSTVAVMVLSEDCDIEMIKEMAGDNEFRMQCVMERQNFLERNYIFRISASN